MKLPEMIATHVGTTNIVTAPNFGGRGWREEKPNDPKNWTCDHWRILFTYDGRAFETSYKTGIGNRKLMPSERHIYQGPSTVKIDPANVLNCLFSDASAALDTFEGWCSDIGYDTDSRKALDMYLACQKTSTDLRKLLGKDYAKIEEMVRES